MKIKIIILIATLLLSIKLAAYSNTFTSNDYYKIGQSGYKNGMLDIAINNYEKAVKLDSKNANLYKDLADAYFARGYHAKAIENYKKAEKLGIESFELYFNIGKSYFSEGLLNISRDYFKKSLKYNPNNAMAYIALGNIEQISGFNSLANNYYKKAHTSNQRESSLYSGLASMYARQGLYDKALQHSAKAIRLNYKDPAYYASLALIYCCKDNYELAVKYFQEAVKLSSNFQYSYNNKFNTYGRKCLYNLAINNINTHLKSNPNDIQAYTALGFAYYGKASYNKAEESFINVSRLSLDNQIIGNLLGLVYYQKWCQEMRLSNLKATTKYLEKSVSYNPDIPEPYLLLGAIYFKESKYDLAIENYKKVVDKKEKSQAINNNMSVYLQLGITYLQIKNYDLAIQNLQKYLNYDISNEYAYYSLGTAYWAIGNYGQAIQNLKKVTTLNDFRTDIGIKLLKATNQKNMIDKAKQLYTSNINLENQFNKSEKILIDNDKNPLTAQEYYNLGLVYYCRGNYELAIKNLEESIHRDLRFKEACSEILKFSYTQQENKEIIGKIQQIKPNDPIPDKLTRLIKFDKGLKTDTPAKTFEIINLIWEDSEGQKLLEIICKQRIPIKITNKKDNPVTETSYYSLSPIGAYYKGINYTQNTVYGKYISINVGEYIVQDFKGDSLDENMQVIMVFIHELCHAVVQAIDKTTSHSNAIEEELSASMIGYNVASRILKQRELSRDECFQYSKIEMQMLLEGNYKSLPIYNDFNEEIMKLGIYPPHPDIYRNIVKLEPTIEKNYYRPFDLEEVINVEGDGALNLSD